MIPFWKKTGKHSKPQSAQKRRQNAKPAVPRTAQQSIPMQRMFEDGTCRVKPNYYTRTIQYQDINYQLAQQEDKTAIFEEYASLKHGSVQQVVLVLNLPACAPCEPFLQVLSSQNSASSFTSIVLYRSGE